MVSAHSKTQATLTMSTRSRSTLGAIALLAIVAVLSMCATPVSAFTPTIKKWWNNVANGVHKNVLSPEDDKLYKVMKHIDRNHDGHVDYEELHDWFEGHRPRHLQWHIDNIRKLHDVDLNGDGVLDDMERNLYSHRYQLSDEETILLLDRWDIDGDLWISNPELRAMQADTLTYKELAGNGPRYSGLKELHSNDFNGDGRVSPMELGHKKTDEGDDRWWEPDPEYHWLGICRNSHYYLSKRFPEYDPHNPDTDYHPEKCDKEQGKEMFKLFDTDDSGYVDHHEWMEFHKDDHDIHRTQHREQEVLTFLQQHDSRYGNNDQKVTINTETHNPDGSMRAPFREYMNSEHGIPMKTMMLDFFDNYLEQELRKKKLRHERGVMTYEERQEMEAKKAAAQADMKMKM